MRGDLGEWVRVPDTVGVALGFVRDLAQLSSHESGRALLGKWGMQQMIDQLANDLAGQMIVARGYKPVMPGAHARTNQ